MNQEVISMTGATAYYAELTFSNLFIRLGLSLILTPEMKRRIELHASKQKQNQCENAKIRLQRFFFPLEVHNLLTPKPLGSLSAPGKIMLSHNLSRRTLRWLLDPGAIRRDEEISKADMIGASRLRRSHFWPWPCT